MLIVNELSAFIYDYGQGELIDQYRHTLLPIKERIDLKKIGDLLAFGSFNRFHLIKTEEKNSGGREIKTVKTIFYDDLVPNLFQGTRLCSHSEFYKLKNGNYLIIAKVYFQDETQEYLGIEVDGETQKILKVKRKDLSEWTSNQSQEGSFYLVDDLLVFVGEEMNLDEGGEMVHVRSFEHQTKFLTLMNLDFKILDQCTQAQLKIDYMSRRAIKLISGNRLISEGANSDFFLHEVDSKSQKLILIKRVIIEGARIHKRIEQEVQQNPISVLCKVSLGAAPSHSADTTKSSDRQYYLLSFDSNWTLMWDLRHTALDPYNTDFLFCSSKQNLVIFSRDGGQPRDEYGVYLLDLIEKKVRVVYPSCSVDFGPSYLFEGNGDVRFFQTSAEAMTLVQLN